MRGLSAMSLSEGAKRRVPVSGFRFPERPKLAVVSKVYGLRVTGYGLRVTGYGKALSRFSVNRKP